MVRKDDWTTPKKLIDYLEDVGHDFNIDAAADEHNAICPQYYSEHGVNALRDVHTQMICPSRRIWCNPPFSLAQQFAEKFIINPIHLNHPLNIVMMLPVRTDRWWFQNLLELERRGQVGVTWFTGRLHFGGAPKGAFMYNVMVCTGFKDIHVPRVLDASEFNENGKGAAKT